MSKYTITLTKAEVVAAVLAYANRQVTINGRQELKEPELMFRDKNGALAYFEVDIFVTEPNTQQEG